MTAIGRKQTIQMKKYSKSRRAFLMKSFSGVLAGYTTVSLGKQKISRTITPHETSGPFYPVTEQEDRDHDLTQISGKNKSAQGEIIWLEAEVIDADGRPLKNTIVELWQANSVGRYRHPFDSNPAPIDPNFQGWAIVKTDHKGIVKFKTIFPGAYPASSNWVRPPHIHFKLNKEGYQELTTQMYFPGQPLNAKDRLLNRKSNQEKMLMIAKKMSDEPDTYSHQFVMASLRNNYVRAFKT